MHEVSSGSGAVGRGGGNVTVVKYLDDVPTTTQLKKLIADAGLTVREAVRTGEAEYKELGLADASDDALLDAMVAHPRLIQRPFVVTAKGTRMARPTEAVDEIL
ncbi:Probable arsenate reductase (ArsC) [Mycobacteroides abscessus]|nr:Probable arsenate reductase (ArsC) [Mycobacteroides abscessus]